MYTSVVYAVIKPSTQQSTPNWFNGVNCMRSDFIVPKSSLTEEPAAATPATNAKSHSTRFCVIYEHNLVRWKVILFRTSETLVLGGSFEKVFVIFFSLSSPFVTLFSFYFLGCRCWCVGWVGYAASYRLSGRYFDLENGNGSLIGNDCKNWNGRRKCWQVRFVIE